MTGDVRGVVAAIPARWGSTRFPGKALADLGGSPMIAHVVRRARAASTVDRVLVATDDERVAAAAVAAGAEAAMTGEHPSGTDRIAAALANRGDWEIVVNVQGDEPMLSAANIDTLVRGLRERPEVGMATLCRPLAEERAGDPNAVKVVRRSDGRALYFSRSAIPYPRDGGAAAGLWRLHLGIYGFRTDALEQFVGWAPSPLERAEGLEQLRALENGMEILVLDAPDPAYGVDTPEDLERVRRLIAGTD
ncbi:MAG: 3-deoxy-manno-octulosonate cytidylyltransferase [Thermoanaerobaculales bacterium]|jgi:3-deoxy-manno-octulosonate cytidylyltransferase (CMP-KDO synthetase)|nr:3-deoxy-manno-octulosonate cytidylyltransferase [Thermoanaerobaculales bacterium]